MPRIRSILLLLLVSCSSATKRNPSDPRQFDAIKLGDRVDRVIAVLGKPTEIRSGDEGDPNESWIYDNATGSQRGTIGMTKRDPSVTTVLVIPDESEPEHRLEYLLRFKFSSGTFEKVPLQRCRRDYVPSEDFYIDVREGIVIEANRRTGEVESFRRTTAQSAVNLLQQVRECKR